MTDRKSIQAKDITDEAFIAAARAVSARPMSGGWANRFDVAAELGFPEKVVLAKARSVIRRGLMDGCTCGCRGDFDLRGFPKPAVMSVDAGASSATRVPGQAGNPTPQEGTR